MSIDNLRSALPDWAKDLSLNLSTLSRSSSLTEQQQWGTFVAAAAATRNESVLVQVMEDARTHLSEEAISAALGAASIMAMNNVAYRTRHFLGSAYENERMGLRMNIIGTSGGVEKVDFELWSLAVSTINGCEKCVTAHEATVRGEGLSTEQVWEAVRIAATRNESVLVQVMEDARTHLSEEAVSAALGAASIMAMNNVAYRTRHFLGSAYENERMGLRMNIIGTSGGVEKVDFELWSLAVSTINGCEKCVTAHEATVRGEGLSTEQVWEAVRIAATLTGVAQAISVVETLD